MRSILFQMSRAIGSILSQINRPYRPAVVTAKTRPLSKSSFPLGITGLYNFKWDTHLRTYFELLNSTNLDRIMSLYNYISVNLEPINLHSRFLL